MIPSHDIRSPGWCVVPSPVEDSKSDSGRTDESLLSSRSTSVIETPNKIRKRSIAKCCQHSVQKYCQYRYLVASFFLIILGILQITFPPYDMMLDIRIRMIPGLPPFDWWLDPPDEVVCKVYIFNVTNSEKFADGTDKKLKLQEIGPIIYREKLIHTNPMFNENGTMTYTANRSLIYLPDRNPEYMLNKTIVMPNIAVLFITSYLYNAPFFVRFGVNLMIRKLDSQVFKKITVEDFLWNLTDPIIDVSQSLAPNLVPTKNLGILSNIYTEMLDNVTVKLGPKYEQRDFFKIDNVDGSPYVPLKKNCEDQVAGASEGVSYFQGINKNDTLRYYRKTLCCIAELKYAKDLELYGLKVAKYELNPHIYDRKVPLSADCYKGEPVLPDGVIDVSSCHYDVSVAASNPHFLHADPNLLDAFEGLNPDPNNHTSFIYVEPITGIPLHGQAKSQLNVVVKDMKGFNERLHKFSNLNIPLLWIEYNQEGIPSKIQWLLYMLTVFMPVFQKVLVAATFLVAILLVILFVRGRRKCRNNLENNKALTFESEKFLKS